ncbi:hypothetical protein FM120_31430 [Sphingobacterium faecium PCAi_F2.5]|nr:hypothetical protein FM120_31430 [Sphingobacterium faecium PCAi_F2.5]
MCEYLSKLTTSEWTAIITMLLALPSTWFLYKTFQSQKESTEIARETSIIDRKAKRAEYLPCITGKIDPTPPYNADGSGSGYTDLYNGQETKINVKIFFNKNSVQLLSFNLENEIKHFSFDYNKESFDKNKIIPNDGYFEIIYNVNFQKYFDIDKDDPITSLIVEAVDQNFDQKFILKNKLKFQDMLGNKYELSFQIKGYNILIISDLEMID